GRFACALGIPMGIDFSPKMLEIAASRGISSIVGNAEQLPFGEACLDGILMALTLCFVSDAPQALLECRRVLRPGGRLLLGMVPADSVWGRAYEEKAAKGHPVYAHAKFSTAAETTELAQRAGFALCDTAGTLFWKPGQTAESEPKITFSRGGDAGFLGLLFRKEGENRP
ncbi:MAG TPA: class I SAM-dependent methyltransferase, partial [Candidatus Hydrogenedentes bacterium]|nr:class I SAM-dependent methyltransferase [Candidatus Hydrogenedentota bacterium]